MTASAHAVAPAPRGAALARWSLALAGAVVAVGLLFALIEQLIVVPTSQPRPGQTPVIDDVRVVNQALPRTVPQIRLPPMPVPAALKPLPQPAAAPAPSAVPTLPALQAPPPAAPALVVAAMGVPVDIGAGANLFGSGAFAGFAGSGNGTGGAGTGGGGTGTGSGSGYGGAADFTGKTLIPLSTARPEITKWAFDHKIEGWVEVAFTVMKNGHVTNVRIINADPKGVFETAAVTSVAHWIYAAQSHPIEVKQRVEFRLKDYQYNWNTN